MLKKCLITVFICLIVLSCENAVKDTFPSDDMVYSNWDVEDYDLVILGYGDATTLDGKSFALNMYNFSKENPDLTIKWDMQYDELYHKKLQSILSSGSQLDIVYMWNGGSRQQPLIDYGEEIDQLQFIDETMFESDSLIGGGANGELFTIPLARQGHTVLYSNNALLTELGLDTAVTYKDLLDQQVIANTANKRVLAYPGATSWCQNTFIFSALLGRFGGAQHVKNIITGDAKFTDQPSIKAFEFIKTMTDDGLFNSTTSASDYEVSLAQFNNSETLYFIDGGWRENQITLPDFSWNKFISIPEEKYPGTINGGYSAGYAILKSATLDTTRLANARSALNYLTGKDASLVRSKISGLVPTFKIDIDEIIFAEGTTPSCEYILSATSITDTIGDYIDSTTTSHYSDGIMEIMARRKDPSDLAAETQVIYEAN